MGDVLRMRAPPGHRADQSAAAAARNKARPLITAWLKKIETEIRAGKLTDSDGRLARALTNFPSANQGICFAGQKRLASALGKTERTIRRGLARLVAAGFLLAKQRGWNRSNRYILQLGGKPLFPDGSESSSMPADNPEKVVASSRTEMSSCDRTEMSSCDRTKMSSYPFESRNPLEDDDPPLPPKPAIEVKGKPDSDNNQPSKEKASGLPKEELSGQPLIGDILGPEPEMSFNEFWEVSGCVGKWGPARAAWNELTRHDRCAIGDLLKRTGRIDLDGTWAFTWLKNRCWEAPAPWRGGIMGALDDALRGHLVLDQYWGGQPTRSIEAAPGSPEWHAERAHLLATGFPVKLMDDWAKQGKGWTCRVPCSDVSAVVQMDSKSKFHPRPNSKEAHQERCRDAYDQLKYFAEHGTKRPDPDDQAGGGEAG